MATANYMAGRKKYNRPQAVLWSENSGMLGQNGLYIPSGYEVNADTSAETNTSLFDNFLILSDHNRKELNFSPIRIEKRERMINGRMRSYHIADKKSLSVSWEMLPSRSFALNPNFNSTTGKPVLETSGYRTKGLDGSWDILPNSTVASQEYTVDGGAGGVDLLHWYQNHKGSFWMFLAYDNYENFKEVQGINNKYAHMNQYNEVMEVFISDFQYSVVKRGQNLHDFWNVSVTLEEV